MRYSLTSLAFSMAVTSSTLIAVTANAAGDPVRGARDFRPCVACHSVKPGEHSIGPSLANVWSRKAGTVEGFLRYSSALGSSDIEWNDSNLDKWLHAPQEFMPGTSMKFRGIEDAQERADIIAYLKTISGNMARDHTQQACTKGKCLPGE